MTYLWNNLKRSQNQTGKKQGTDKRTICVAYMLEDVIIADGKVGHSLVIYYE